MFSSEHSSSAQGPLADETGLKERWLVRNWYAVGLSKDVKPAQMIARAILGKNFLIGRQKSGALFVLQDQCPHRAAPLSAGDIEFCKGRARVRCPYHGWAFDGASGQCVQVPALSEDQPLSFEKISVRTYCVKESVGLIWIYLPAVMKGKQKEDKPVAFPDLGVPEGLSPCSITIVDAHGDYREAVVGLVDPAHTPYVHQQWWWRKGRAAREKYKVYETLPTGFRIPAHPPSGNSLVYKLIGGKPSTQIDFLLPGLRVETIKNNRYTIVGLTVITPIGAGKNRIIHVVYWDMPLLTMLKPVIDAMASSFLQQDGDMLDKQASRMGQISHRPLYLGDPDVPAQWYYQLFNAWNEQMVIEIGSEFNNPIRVQDLRWRT